MTEHELPTQFCINDLEVNTETGEIITDGETQVVEPKVMALLNVFAQKPRQVLSSEMLFNTVWPNAIYSPNSVRRNVAHLRQALSDEDKSIIKTHPKRGYSLDAEVKFATAQTKQLSNDNKQNKYFAAITLSIVALLIMSLFFNFYDSNKAISLGDLTPVTASNQSERYMQISPDGQFMAFIRNTEKIGQRELLIKELATNSIRQLKADQVSFTYLAWDNDTRGLIYSFIDSKGISFSRLQLNTQGEVVSEELLFSRRDITWNSLFFIDKQQNLYYLANRNSSEHSRDTSLYSYNLTTGQTKNVLNADSYYKPYKIALSPDKSQLALIGFNEQGLSEIKLLNLTEQSLVSVGETDHNWHFMTWFEDGNSLLLSNGSNLSKLTLNGELTAVNFRSYNFLIYPQIVKDKLYFIEAKSDQDILISDMSQLSSPKKIIDSNTVDKGAAVSPNGNYIAYISAKNGLPQLFIKDRTHKTERLIFANSDKEYALTTPIWNKSGNQLISSLNNKPFIINFEQDSESIHWLHQVLGIPLAWYKNSDAILLVDKSSPNDQLVKLDLSNLQPVALNLSLKGGTVFLDHEDKLLRFTNHQVLYQDSAEPLLGKDTFVNNVFSTENGFFYLSTDQEKSKLGFYDYLQGNTKVSAELQDFCLSYCEQITELKGNTILLKEQHNSADVLSLSIFSN